MEITKEKRFEFKVPAHYSDPYFNLAVYKAAPDLYEALWELILAIGALPNNHPSVVKAKKALAKAENK